MPAKDKEEEEESKESAALSQQAAALNSALSQVEKSFGKGGVWP